MDAFTEWSRFLDSNGVEGGFSDDPRDWGNWTGGAPNRGELKGTKYGISAAAHPTLDIKSLTKEDAVRLRKSEYWDKIRGEDLPPDLAFVVADAAYMSGPKTAISQLQEVLHVPVDGVIGPITMNAVHQETITLPLLKELLASFCTKRLLFESTLDNWDRYKGGWTHRLFSGLITAVNL